MHKFSYIILFAVFLLLISIHFLSPGNFTNEHLYQIQRADNQLEFKQIGPRFYGSFQDIHHRVYIFAAEVEIIGLYDEIDTIFNVEITPQVEPQIQVTGEEAKLIYDYLHRVNQVKPISNF